MRCIPVLAILVALAAPARADDTDDTTCTCDVAPAACDAGCACDSECTIDWSADECAAPDAGCLANPIDPSDDALVAAELAQPDDASAVEWSAGTVTCPDGTVEHDGACIATAAPAVDAAGCTTTRGAGIAIALALIGLVVIARRRRRVIVALALLACTQDALDWDGVLDAGVLAGDHVDVYAADSGDGARFLLAGQPLAPGAEQPVAAFAL